MEVFKSQFWIILLLFIAMIITGIVLSKKGRPLKTSLLTFHKLLAIGTIVFFIVLLKKAQLLNSLNVFLSALIVVFVVVFLFGIATGAILSFEKPAPKHLLGAHKIITIVLFVTFTVLGAIIFFN